MIMDSKIGWTGMISWIHHGYFWWLHERMNSWDRIVLIIQFSMDNSVFLRVSPDVPGVFLDGFFLDFSWIFHGFFLDFSWIFPRFFMEFLWIFPRISLDCSWNFLDFLCIFAGFFLDEPHKNGCAGKFRPGARSRWWPSWRISLEGDGLTACMGGFQFYGCFTDVLPGSLSGYFKVSSILDFVALAFEWINEGLSSSSWGLPLAGWFINVYFMENPNLEWMRTGGSPILGNLHMVKNGVVLIVSTLVLVKSENFCWTIGQPWSNFNKKLIWKMLRWTILWLAFCYLWLVNLPNMR